MSRKQRIHELLSTQLTPSFIHVEDESNRHHVPKEAQTHFKVILVSEEFKNCTRVQRHQQVNRLLMTEFNTGMHALSLHLFTLEEWEAKGKSIDHSPSCKDGYDGQN